MALVLEDHARQRGGPSRDPIPLELTDAGEHRRDGVAVGRGRPDPELAPDRHADERLEAHVGGDHELTPVRRGPEALEIVADRLPGRILEEPGLGGLDRKLPEMLLEVHRVEHDGLREPLLQRGLQHHGVRDRVREAVARGRGGGQPQAVLHVRRHLEVLA